MQGAREVPVKLGGAQPVICVWLKWKDCSFHLYTGSWGPMPRSASSVNKPKEAAFVDVHTFRLSATERDDSYLIDRPMWWDDGSHSTFRK